MRKLKHETTVETSGGGQVTTSKTYSVRADSENFFQIFLESMAGLLQIKNATDHRVMYVLNSMAEFNTGRVILSSVERKTIIESLDVDDQTFSNSLRRLKAAGLLDGDRGIYTINPLVFWKGTTDERKKLLRQKGFELKVIFKPSEEFDKQP
jgi:hypothetical protein